MNKKRSLFLIIIAFFFIFVRHSSAAEISSQSAAPINSRQDVNYFLAYPGILPDSPFHFLKAARDRVVSILINDDTKRAEFNLLTSDKRMFAGRILIEKGKVEKGLITISKSNNYYHLALSALRLVKIEDNSSLNNLKDRFSLSISKHLEVMDDVKPFIPEKDLPLYQYERGRMVDFKKSVEVINKENNAKTDLLFTK